MNLMSPGRLAGLSLIALLAAASSPSAASTTASARPLFLPMGPTPPAAGAAYVPGGANLIADGGFETPVVPKVGYEQTFPVGYTLGPWSVVGPYGSTVLLIGDKFTEMGYTFPAGAGKQFLDLTGAGQNLPGGVAQTVNTTPGTTYTLSFEVGNIGSAPEGPTATVLAMVNNVQLLTAENFSGVGLTYQVWESFSASFTATSSATTITFINESGPAPGLNGLDAVKLVAQ